VKKGQDLLSIYSADLAGAFNNNYPVLRTASGGTTSIHLSDPVQLSNRECND
jgi:hypothetical protein